MLFRKDLPESYQEGILGYLETRLGAHPFVAGEEFTCGDVAVGAHLLFFKVFLPQVRSPSAARVRVSPGSGSYSVFVFGSNC